MEDIHATCEVPEKDEEPIQKNESVNYTNQIKVVDKK